MNSCIAVNGFLTILLIYLRCRLRFRPRVCFHRTGAFYCALVRPFGGFAGVSCVSAGCSLHPTVVRTQARAVSLSANVLISTEKFSVEINRAVA
jgi:hypothetical protein